jgi:hypothetical protein
MGEKTIIGETKVLGLNPDANVGQNHEGQNLETSLEYAITCRST